MSSPIDKLKIIKNKYPYSKYALDASLRLADVYFLQESYTEAALAYESFRDLHPKHEKVPYAMFRIGTFLFQRYAEHRRARPDSSEQGAGRLQ